MGARLFYFGAGGESRTPIIFRSLAPKASASANFATPANLHSLVLQEILKKRFWTRADSNR